MISLTPPAWESEFHRRAPVIYPFDALMGAGILSGGAARSVSVPRLILDTNAGANRMAESVESVSTQWATPALGLDMFQYPIIAAVTMVGALTGAPVSLDSQIGFELGSAGAFADPAAPAFGLVKLFADLFNARWTLRTALGDGTAFLDTQLGAASFPPFDGTPVRLMLVYSPAQYVAAYANGALLGTVVTAAKIPASNSGLNAGLGVGCYVKSSNNALDRTAAEFSGLSVERIGRV